MGKQPPTPPHDDGCAQDYVSLLSPHPLQTGKLKIDTSSPPSRPTSRRDNKTSYRNPPEIDNNGDTALHHLCDSPHIPLSKVSALLESPSGISSIMQTNVFGRNPLHKLCGNRSYSVNEDRKIEIATLLLEVLTPEEKLKVLNESGSGGGVYTPEKIAWVRGDEKLRRFLEGQVSSSQGDEREERGRGRYVFDW